MDSSKKKIEKFKESCYSIATQEANNISKQINDEISENTKSILDKYENEMLANYENEVIKLNHKYNSEIFNLSNNARHEIIQKRQELEKDIINDVKEKLIEYTDSEGYSEFLKNNIKQAIEKLQVDKEDCIYVYLTKKDINKLKYSEENKVDYIIDEMDDNNIGGSICINKSKNISVNNTLKESLNYLINNNQILK